MRGRHLKVLAFATVMAMGVSACAGDEADDAGMDETPAASADQTPQPAEQEVVDLPEGVTQEQYTQGKQLFSGQGGCHACHGPQATGTQLGPNLTDDEWINISGRNVDEIVEVIKTGVPQPQQHPGPMPPMGGANLDDAQIQALAAYVAGLGQG